MNEMYLKYFKTFGLEVHSSPADESPRYAQHARPVAPHRRSRRRGTKFVNEPELWKKTEDMTREVLKNSGINYVEVANEAACYGPKIDVQVWRCLHTATTSAANSQSPPTRWTSPCPRASA